MAVFPKISSIFAGSFTAITESSKKSVKGSKGEWYLSVNDATGYGEPATLITGIILMPLVLIVAFALPGNKTLPMLDLIALPYLMQPIVAISDGNILKSTISGLVWFAICLFACTYTAPMFTEVAQGVGVELATGSMLITSLVILGQPFAALIFLPFVLKSPLYIGILLVVYVISYILMKKYKTNLHEYLERNVNNLESSL